MSKEHGMYLRNERKGKGQRLKDGAKDKLLWAGEKSIYLTLPMTGVLFMAGAIPASSALAFGILDIGGNLAFKSARNKENQKIARSKTVYQVGGAA